MKKILLPLALILVLAACSKKHHKGSSVGSNVKVTPVAKEHRPFKPRANSFIEPEQCAIDFIHAVKDGAYHNEFYRFETEAHLSHKSQAKLFKSLSEYIHDKDWQLKYTFVTTHGKKADFADLYFQSMGKHSLVLICKNENEKWKVSSFEFPDYTFKKSSSVSFERYVQLRVLAQMKRSHPYFYYETEMTDEGHAIYYRKFN